MKKIVGRKGGKQKQHTPVETPDSLQSLATARILLLLGEGEFAGSASAPNRGELVPQDIYLDGTPLAQADGTLNFPGVKWDFRPGTEDQTYIPGLTEVENAESISNYELKESGNPYIHTPKNNDITALKVRLGVVGLLTQETNGDVKGAKVDYEITLEVDSGTEKSVLKGSFSGKASSQYERTHRIALPPGGNSYTLRVYRRTPDSTTSRVQDGMRVFGVTECIDAKLRYPNSALLFVTFNAKQFSNIPQVSVKTRGRVIRVPNNYDPETRTYSGAWNGSFKWAYSNNPAWVFYDIILNEQFGLGDRLDATQVDKWELYRIGVYCDGMVDGYEDNKRVKHARFLCDVYIQNQNEAFNVLRDLAAIFRGMTYWAQNQLFAIADIPMDRVYTYTRANVVNGKFTYAGGSERNRFSSALVSWSNPANHYADEVEIVAENDLITRYGIKQTQISAIGCTRQSEANRRGRWALLTNSKDRMVTFSTGLDGFLPLPGYIVGVQDAMLSGKIMGGRIVSANARQIVLDRPCDARVGDRLFLNLPEHSGANTVGASRQYSEARTISAIDATRKIITVNTDYSQQPEPEAIWSIDSDRIAVQLFRVTSVIDNDDGTFTISAIFHNPQKYDYIDSGARMATPTITAIDPGTISAPKGLKVEGRSRIYQNQSIATLRATWNAVPGAVAYEAQWQKDNGEWINLPRQAQRSFEVEGIYAGDYIVQVRAIDISNVSSQWARSQPASLLGKYGQPPMVANFLGSGANQVPAKAYAIDLTWAFQPGSEDALNVEIRIADSPLPASATDADYEALQFLSDVPYPAKSYSHVGLGAAASFWYTARLVDRIGNKSGWIKPMVQGVSSSSAVDYLAEINKAIMASTAWDQLNQQIKDIDINAGSGIERDFRLAMAAYDNYMVDRHDYNEAHALIEQVKQTIADDKQAVALQIDSLKTNFADNAALIQQESQARSTAQSAMAQQLTNLQASVNNDVKAQIQTEVSARTTSEAAIASRIAKVEATLGTQAASISTMNKAITDKDKAMADRVTQVKATADGASTTVQQHTTAIAGINSKLTGQWGVKIETNTLAGRKLVAGLQLGVDGSNKGTATESQFIVLANTFAVYNPQTKAPKLAFAVDKNGNTIMADAIIGNGTITNAKIGGTISSTGYTAGVTGWSLNKDKGTFEINGGIAGKGTVIIGNGLITVKDNTGKVRVRMGLW